MGIFHPYRTPAYRRGKKAIKASMPEVKVTYHWDALLPWPQHLFKHDRRYAPEQSTREKLSSFVFTKKKKAESIRRSSRTRTRKGKWHKVPYGPVSVTPSSELFTVPESRRENARPTWLPEFIRSTSIEKLENLATWNEGSWSAPSSPAGSLKLPLVPPMPEGWTPPEPPAKPLPPPGPTRTPTPPGPHTPQQKLEIARSRLSVTTKPAAQPFVKPAPVVTVSVENKPEVPPKSPANAPVPADRKGKGKEVVRTVVDTKAKAEDSKPSVVVKDNVRFTAMAKSPTSHVRIEDVDDEDAPRNKVPHSTSMSRAPTHAAASTSRSSNIASTSTSRSPTIAATFATRAPTLAAGGSMSSAPSPAATSANKAPALAASSSGSAVPSRGDQGPTIFSPSPSHVGGVYSLPAWVNNSVVLEEVPPIESSGMSSSSSFVSTLSTMPAMQDLASLSKVDVDEEENQDSDKTPTLSSAARLPPPLAPVHTPTGSVISNPEPVSGFSYLSSLPTQSNHWLSQLAAEPKPPTPASPPSANFSWASSTATTFGYYPGANSSSLSTPLTLPDPWAEPNPWASADPVASMSNASVVSPPPPPPPPRSPAPASPLSPMSAPKTGRTNADDGKVPRVSGGTSSVVSSPSSSTPLPPLQTTSSAAQYTRKMGADDGLVSALGDVIKVLKVIRDREVTASSSGGGSSKDKKRTPLSSLAASKAMVDLTALLREADAALAASNVAASAPSLPANEGDVPHLAKSGSVASLDLSTMGEGYGSLLHTNLTLPSASLDVSDAVVRLASHPAGPSLQGSTTLTSLASAVSLLGSESTGSLRRAVR